MTQKSGRPERFAGHRYPQRIPEPDAIEQGSPAPWAGLVASSRTGLSLDVVTSRLRRAGRLLDVDPLPSAPAGGSIVADAAPAPIVERSAVLVALFEESRETHVILTRRSASLRNHGGEIALPGGRCEADESPVETALREAREEIGLAPSLVTPLAWLSPMMAVSANSSIWPIVGVLAVRPELVINPDEVERVFSVALADLVADGAFVEERWRRALRRPDADDEGFFPIYFFKVPDEVIWGATARVLVELLALVIGAPWPPVAS